MFKILNEFFAASQPFVESFNVWSEKYDPGAEADHICYKCGNTAEFEYLRALFENDSHFVYQSIISRRRIAIIKFTSPIKTVLGDIEFLELSDQKPDGSQVSGFDHIEIYPSVGSVADLVSELAKNGFVLQEEVRPHHTTFDAVIEGNFKVRLEPEALVDKIKVSEMF